MTPQTITPLTNTYVLLHELNKSQLNIGEVQISGLCAKCSALGKLLTQEVSQHQLGIKRNKANNLCRELNEISTAINKNLVQQLPLIKMQMEKSLNQMTLPEGARTSNAQMAQDQTYVKTVNLLQENIVRIDQQLESAAKRVFEAVGQTKQNELQKLLKSLVIYESTMCGVNLMSTEFSRLSIYLSCLKSNTEIYIGGVDVKSEKAKLQQFSSAIDELITRNKILFESFQEQEINKLPLMKIFDSAKQKYSNLTKQLTEGNFSHADILLAVAQRHETEKIVAYGLQQMELIHSDYNHLSDEVMTSLQNFQLDDINSLAEELIQSEPVSVAAAPMAIKKPLKAVHTKVEKETTVDVANEPDSDEKLNIMPKSLPKKFHVELSKLADWLSHDVKALKNSTSNEKRKLGQTIGEQLDHVYGQIDADKWPSGQLEIQQYKTDIEKRLGALGQLIEEAMAQNSPPNSPPASPKPAEVKRSETKLPAVATKESTAEVVDIRPAPALSAFDTQLQNAIQKLNAARKQMFDAYSRQEGFRQTLLKRNQPNSIAWMNIYQTDMVLDYISQNIAIQPHVLFVRPYMEQHLPMAEMIRCIQAERLHPHFDQRNCQTYLGHASNWLDTLTPHFDYLDQLMSVTESMVTDKQRVA